MAQAETGEASPEPVENVELLRLALAHVPGVILIQDRDLRYIWVSNGAKLGPVDTTGLTDSDVFPGEAGRRLKSTKQRVLTTGNEERGESYVDGLGKRMCLEWIIEPWRDADGAVQGLVVYFRDITARKNNEEALAASQKLEGVGLLAGGVAHDFNNLLTGILGQTSLALAKLAPEHPAAIHVIKAVRAAERAADLTRQLLAYAGKGQFQVERLDLNGVICESLTLIETALPKSVRLRLALDLNLPVIHADRSQVQQTLLNLSLNAAEAMPEGGSITVRTGRRQVESDNDRDSWINEAIPAPGSYISLQVSDNGGGMNAATLARIFDPFFSTKALGRGLGLPAVLGIVRASKGGLQVTSQVDGGSTVTILWPEKG